MPHAVLPLDFSLFPGRTRAQATRRGGGPAAFTSAFAVAAAIAIGAGCGGDSGDEAELSRTTRCERAMDRAVELQVDPKAPDRAAHVASMREAVGARFVSMCARDDSALTDDALLCMQRAESREALAACAGKTP